MLYRSQFITLKIGTDRPGVPGHVDNDFHCCILASSPENMSSEFPTKSD